MTVVNDIFQLKLFTESPSSPVTALNVFWYKLLDFGGLPGGSPVAAELSVEFKTIVGDLVAATLFTEVDLVRTEVVNYNDVLDFDICTAACGYPIPGLRTGGAAPYHVCWSYRLSRPGPGFRNGYKRFSGISEVDVNNFGEAGAGVLAALNSLAGVLGLNLTTPSTVIFEPVVVTGAKVLGVNPASYAFLGAEYAGVGSQVSRKKPLNP